MAQPSSWHLCPVSEKHEMTLDATLIWQGCPQNSICWSLQYLYTCRLGLGKRQVASQSKSVFRPAGLHVFLDVYFLMRFDMLCFYQSNCHCGSPTAIRDGPQKKKGPISPLHFTRLMQACHRLVFKKPSRGSILQRIRSPMQLTFHS